MEFCLAQLYSVTVRVQEALPPAELPNVHYTVTLYTVTLLVAPWGAGGSASAACGRAAPARPPQGVRCGPYLGVRRGSGGG
eukprot:8717422-Pyramimonas_sp.AAC.1